jgi:hypothetical protein
LGFKPSGKYVTVKNGDGSSQLSMGSVKVTMSIGCNFKAVVTVQIINLDVFDFVIGLDMIRAYKMELRHDPFRVTAVSYSNLRGPSNASRAPRRVNLPICINSLKDDEGHDASHYLCDVQNFRAECAIQGLPEEEALVLIPDENDAFSYRQLLMQLAEMKDQVEADDIVSLLTKVVDVQLPERKELVKDSKVATDDGLEDSFRARVISEFPSLCADSLPHDGPAARQLDGSPFRVKLRLKEGIEPQGRRPYRIPESYRPEMEKTIAKLLEFKLIEPSISHYSNPVFLVPKPPLRDGSPGGLRFVWDGRSVNRAIKADSFLIPRVEDLIERIARLKHEANAKGITEMWISTLDLRTSFWQLTLDEASRPLTSFSTTAGTYQWTCVPMGLLTASQEMQRFAEGVLQPFSSSTTFEYTDAQGATKRAHGTAAVYIDDTCVVSFGTREEHEILLLRVLKRMDVHNLKMQPAKCDFLRHEASFLGHVLRADGILTQDSKISAIKNWPPLTDIRSVRAFVSLCSYYRKYIWRFAEIAAPLTNLLKDGGWRPPSDPEVLTAVEKLKEALISSPVLAYFDVNAVATDLYCDASGGSIGAVLQQTDKDGEVRPVGFYSRKLTPAEERYSTYDRELVGLRDSCLHFRYQLLGVPFTVRTDHSSLRWILSQPDLTAIRQRWLAILSQFQMTEISHVAGKDNVVADALSRYPELAGQSYDHLLPEEQEMDLLCAHLFNITTAGGDTTLCVDDFGSTIQLLPHDDSSPVDYSEEVVENLTLPSPSKVGMDGYAASSFVTADLEASVFSDAYPSCSDFQSKYDALQEHIGSDKHHTFPDYTIRNGLLIYFDGLKSRICVPTPLRGRLLEICHDSPLGGHTGARKLKYEMMPQFFWPQMSSHIDKYVASCEHCQRNKSYNSSTRGIPQPHAIPSRRFDVISVDLLSGFPTTKNGYDCIVAFTDRLTKRAYISPCHKSSSAKDLATIFMQTVFRHQGMPRVILSDNGPQFVSEFWKQLFLLLETSIRLTSSYHPQSNGGQEKFNKTLIEALRTYVSHRHDNWDECLLYFEFAYNNSVNPSTGMSPFILSYAQSPRAPWQFLDTYVALDEAVPAEASDTQKGSGAQLASYLGLDIINNVREARDSLHRMTDDFRIRNATLAKPHPYKAGDSVLLSTKNVNLNLPCKKLSPAFVGPFTIRSLLGTNAVRLNYSERFQLLNPTVNIVYLRPYRLRTPDIGPPPKSLSAKPVEVELDGSSWYQVEDILDHRGSPGPMCDCLVRWKDFDVSHDSWVRRNSLTPLALQAYERFLTEHVQFCEERAKNSKIKMYAQQLTTARKRLLSFTGNGRYSVLKSSSTTLISSETTFPIAAASMTSDVAPNAPTAGEAVAPISTSSSGRVLRRPTHYKDTTRR